MNFLEGDISVAKPFGFGADPDHDPDPGILTEFLPLRNMDNFAESAALAEVCRLRVFLVIIIIIIIIIINENF